MAKQIVKASDDVVDEPIAPRDGDKLVVAYPEVTIGIAQFNFVKVGGLVYERKMVAGDDVGREYARIYSFLKRRAEEDGKLKCAEWLAELQRARRS